MNYALDALWWRLTHPQVRDLAVILTAPALWRSDCELDVRMLLGEHGFRYLIDLNDDLHSRLPETTEHRLLGKYAEDLLAFWLEHAPHCRLLVRNIPIFNDDNQSVGELDFIAEINGQIYHIELACKYYGAEIGLPKNMVGLNPSDTLLLKINKLKQQLNLSTTTFGRKALADCGINADQIRRVSVVRGTAFTASGSLPVCAAYPVNAWTGIWVNDIQHNIFKGEKWFYRLPKTAFLAPARISGSLKTAAADLGDDSGLIAEVALRPDGFWHEIQRIMFAK